MENLNQFIKTCKHHNLKLTPQRVIIFKAIQDSETHPSAEIIHRKVKEEFPSISLDTVCRTLAVFVEIGILDLVEGYGAPKRYDPNMEQHHHFYCLGCGAVIDFYSESLDRIHIPEEIKARFQITSQRLVLNGYCKTCCKQE